MRFNILMRDDFTCQYCGARSPDTILHVDHRVSVYDGGGNHDENLVTACISCNLGKGKKSVENYSADYIEFSKEMEEVRDYLESGVI